RNLVAETARANAVGCLCFDGEWAEGSLLASGHVWERQREIAIGIASRDYRRTEGLAIRLEQLNRNIGDGHTDEIGCWDVGVSRSACHIVRGKLQCGRYRHCRRRDVGNIKRELKRDRVAHRARIVGRVELDRLETIGCEFLGIHRYSKIAKGIG